MSLSLLEKLEAWIVGVVSGLIAYYMVTNGKVADTAYTNLMSAGVTFSAIAIGFLASVLSIMVVISSHEVVGYILAIDQTDQMILKYLASVIRWALLLLVVSGIGFLVPKEIWFTPWCFTATATVAAFERASRVIVSLVRRSLYSSNTK
ncbi:hypothetical protein CIG75_17450 [Tumebacillus algifaecis]|uniref:Uncharacterized protein n=1 Tax=Tumebacillus algifaecis TaxID=1214604 RepID=A0A223D4P9_9BACL|nr:hypothetical protein [Tumebacillus algifaecis]ASS76572.1 hypothetical protein CIG75_17450 [Tumebacillus algifaecis]